MTRWLVLMVVVSGGGAWACSCSRQARFFPENGSTGVPTNVVVQFFGNAAVAPSEEVSLVARVDSVALSVETRGRNWVSLTPARALLPQTEYRLVIGAASSPDDSVTFTTGLGPDTRPPEATATEKVDRHDSAGSSCGPGQSFVFTLAASTDDTGPVAFVVFTGPDIEQLASRPQAMLEDGFLVDALCSRNFPLLQTPDLAVAVSALDWAGNLSTPTPARQLKSAGCAAAPGGLLVVCALWLIRRRRRQRPA